MNNDWRGYDELYHHGVKGQKWGVRRFQNADGTLTAKGRNHRNERYSDEQYGRDKQVYGTLAARRINRNMNKGDMVSTARSKEAARIAGFREGGTWAGRGLSAATSIAMMLGGADKVKDVLNKSTNFRFDALLGNDSPYAFLVNTGIASISGTLAYKAGHGGAMVAGGYSPTKFRYN